MTGRSADDIRPLRKAMGLTCALACVALSVPASGQESGSSPAFSVAAHAGVGFPQLTSELQTWPVFGLEGGYAPDFTVAGTDRPLRVGLDLMFTQPGAQGEGASSVLGGVAAGGAEYRWELTQQMLIVEVYGAWRHALGDGRLGVYGVVGPRVYLLRSVMDARGNGGEDFGTHEESLTKVGFVAGSGVDFELGPGAAFAGAEFGWSGLDGRMTGESNTGTLVLDVGYRFDF